MSFAFNPTTSPHLNHLRAPSSSFFFFAADAPGPIGEPPRPWRRQRFKPNPRSHRRPNLSVLRSHFHFDPSPAADLLSHLPSVAASLDHPIAPALLGFASAAVLVSRFFFGPSNRSLSTPDAAVEWLLFATPTPFNRFALLRCPSVLSSDGGELLLPPPESASDKSAVKVRVRGGGDIDDDPLEEERPAYQRVCVGTDDGGVISLDWPADLDLKADRGLDTALLLVPGSAQGSSEKSVRSFVRVSLGRGYFPIVMNPRGCAGSPLTTARLFTAADSDDVHTAIRFINKERPWTALMGVGWGYGANMLTKYLSEFGDQTPLMAATCIDNPFDLEEATRLSPYHIAIGQKLTSGLISILQSNKEIFQGRAKGFDVKMALLAKSVRDFDKAISMVSHGYENIEDFYSKSSMRDVANLKIPVLFIQNDDGTVPLFSIPRNSIVENPYTSLLLCSCLPSLGSGQSAVSRYLPVTIEWLTAVELGLLKGHHPHPLLQDVDVSLNPATSLAFRDRGLSKHGDKVTTRLLDLAQSNVANGYCGDPIFDMLAGSDVSHSHMYGKYLLKDLGPEDKRLQPVNSGTLQPVKSDETESVQQDVVMDTEKGQGLQTAQVVMNMLDITLPDTLNEEEKKRVLTSVDQGETLMKALQDAVPEDVRDKLTTAASEILHAQGSNLGRLPEIASGLTSNIQEKVSGLSTAGVNSLSSDERKLKDNQVEWADNNKPDMIRRSGGQESKFQPLHGLQTDADLNKSESISTYGGDDSVAVKKRSDKSDKDEEKAIQCPDYNEDKLETVDKDNHCYGGDVSLSVKKGSDENDKRGEQVVQYSDYNEDKLETGDRDNLSNLTEKSSGTEATAIEPCSGDIDCGNNQLDKNEENSFHKNAEKLVKFSSDQDTTHKPAQEEETVSAQKAGPEAQPTESENVNTQKMEDESTLPVPDNKPIFSNADPAFSVTEAFDALTGIDDSTQVAVNSVFGVIEDMITQYAEKDDNETQDRIQVKNKNSASDVKSENKKHEPSIQPDISHEHSSHKGDENSTDSQNDIITSSVEEELTHNSISSTRNGTDSIEQSNTAGPVGNGGDERNENMVNGKLSAENSNRYRLVSNTQFCESIYRGSLYNQFLQNNILSKRPNAKRIDPNTTTALFSYYFPESQRKLLEKPGNNSDSFGISASLGAVNGEAQSTTHSNLNNGDTIIEPAYLILDTVGEQEPVGEYVTVDRVNKSEEIPGDKSEEMTHSVNQNETVMVGHVGAVTAALGASALLVHQQDSYESNENSETSSKAFQDKIDYQREPENQEEASHKKNEDVVTSLAEKAMSVAGPVVPTKEPGEVDQERLVAMLANLGQKGGGLKLFGKIALLWGGLRGAMSLTEKLILFLHIAERPLHQRIFGFVFMVLVMWAPVLVPFLPTLVQSWTTHNPSRFAELACITGFYAAVTILVVLWGKRIRSYGNPLQQYGLDLASLPKIQNFLKGLIGGFALILLIHSVNAKLGFLSISWPSIFPPPLDSMAWLKLYWKMLMWAGQGIVTALGVALVEELLFRAWLPQEIAEDLGYDCGIIISGLAFSLFQRSPRAIPGLWLLSLGLAGARLRSDGSLSTPIGLRSGIMASSYILQKGGFLTYRPSSSAWLTGTHPFEPFSGVVGLIFCLLLAIVLYPRQPLHKKV